MTKDSPMTHPDASETRALCEDNEHESPCRAVLQLRENLRETRIGRDQALSALAAAERERDELRARVEQAITQKAVLHDQWKQRCETAEATVARLAREAGLLMQNKDSYDTRADPRMVREYVNAYEFIAETAALSPLSPQERKV